jgi:hypothetical protein
MADIRDDEFSVGQGFVLPGVAKRWTEQEMRADAESRHLMAVKSLEERAEALQLPVYLVRQLENCDSRFMGVANTEVFCNVVGDLYYYWGSQNYCEHLSSSFKNVYRKGITLAELCQAKKMDVEQQAQDSELIPVPVPVNATSPTPAWFKERNALKKAIKVAEKKGRCTKDLQAKLEAFTFAA